jgi:2-oxoglutarate dehydrogenase E1 component
VDAAQLALRVYMSESLAQRYQSSPLFGSNSALVEEYYERFLADPASVPPPWQAYFRALGGSATDVSQRQIQEAIARDARKPAVRRASTPESGPARGPQPESPAALAKQAAVLRLIWAYRLHGHKLAALDPLGLTKPVAVPDLDPAYHGLTAEDMEQEFFDEFLAGTQRRKLREIIDLLRQIYTRSIGAEFAHLSSTPERLWLRERLEVSNVTSFLSAEEKREVFDLLTAAEGIERYLHTRYVGQKRFSLEGGETLIPMLEELIQQSGRAGMKEIVIGMAHRGRINVLVNVLGKPPRELFSEFEGLYELKAAQGSGDVKYHMGFSADVHTAGGDVHVALAFNPSHLEIVDPVVEGSVRARQDRRNDHAGDTVMPVVIHGDAAFSGQGVVMETLQLSGVRAFRTGGTIHIIVNNQIGFTMSDPQDARSTPYCSDVAKLLEAPVLHVNANDPESALLVTRIALDYRATFGKDIVIDLVCYRRHGHNEADEPAATQPIMYRAIRSAKAVRRLYAEQLVQEGVIRDEDVRALVETYRKGLDEGRLALVAPRAQIGAEGAIDWSAYRGGEADVVETAIPPARIAALSAVMTTMPEGFELHPRVARIIDDRRSMASGSVPVDWGFAETLAYASLLEERWHVRMSGQDSARGTFFHRHAVLHNQTDNAVYVPLQHVAANQGRCDIYDSLLSEEAVLGFEYGYSTTAPDCLVVWEAQFGDFANGAQVVIDQFISSGETKWGRMCGLVMFLPHGYEGQGPEHSSARLERFLQLCAEGNMQVCVPSTPAQMFHMLRRQMLRHVRKPLVVMTPKSLLRHPQSTSRLDELSGGRFRLLIDEHDDFDAERVTRVVLCSGKVYYDLLHARNDGGNHQVALARVEQLYPFPVEEYAAVLARYRNVREIVWCQEEPENQGAWYQIRHRLQEPLGRRYALSYAGRAASAAPAVGYYNLHGQQQRELVASALGTAAPGREAAEMRKKA